MKKLFYGLAILVVFAAGAGALAVNQIKTRSVAAFETNFNQLKGPFAKVEHGAVDVDVWKRTLTVNDISLLPSNGDPESQVRIAKVTAIGVAQTGDSFEADQLLIEALTASVRPMAEITGRVSYEAPTLLVEGFTSRAFPAVPGISTVSWTRKLLAGITAKSVSMPTLKSVTTQTQSPAAATVGPAPPFSAPLEQVFHNLRLDGMRDGKIAKATIERVEMKSRLPPPSGDEFTVEARAGYITDYDLAASLSIIDPDSTGSAISGYTDVWRTAGSGPITVKAGKTLNLSIGSITSDSIAFDTSKFRTSLAAMQAGVSKSARPTPQQAQAAAIAAAHLYESIKLAAFEYKDMVIEVPGLSATKIGLFRTDRFENGTIGKFTLDGLDGSSPQGGSYHLDHFALDGLKASQLIRLTSDLAAAGATGQTGQMGWAVLQTLDGFQLDGLIVPGQTGGAAPVRIDSMRASWGNFIGTMPMTGQFLMKGQIPMGATGQEPIAVLGRLGIREPVISLAGKWAWNEARQTVDIGPVSSEVYQAASASFVARITNIRRSTLAGGPMMLAIAMPELKVGAIGIEMKDLGLFHLAGKDAETKMQMDQGMLALRSTIDALPPERTEQRALMEAVLKFLSTPGSQLSVGLKPKGDVGLGALLASLGAGPQFMAFLTDQMTATITVGP